MKENLKIIGAVILLICLLIVYNVANNGNPIIMSNNGNEICSSRGHAFKEDICSGIPERNKVIDTKDSSYIITYNGLPTNMKCLRCDFEKTYFTDSIVKIIWKNKNLCVKKK